MKRKESRIHLVKLFALKGQKEEPKETKKDWLKMWHQNSTVSWKPKEQSLKKSVRSGGSLLTFLPLLIRNPSNLIQSPSLP